PSGRRLPGLFAHRLAGEQHLQEEHYQADGDRAVRDVERRPMQRRPLPPWVVPVPVDEVDHVSAQETIDRVADCAAQYQSERDLQVALGRGELAVVAEDEDHRRDADQIEERDAKAISRSGEKTPGGAAILRVPELPEARDDLHG